MGSVFDATEQAIASAEHLTAMDEGALEALRTLARKIDDDDALRAAYLRYRLDRGEDESKMKPLQLDNVSIPTYLKFCESLGLTPAGRDKLKEKKPEAAGGKLSKLRSVPKPAS